jgi:protein tyrosine/serine phosphatase
MSGVFNFRDLTIGHHSGPNALRAGLIYRSDGLHRCPPDERIRVAELGIRRVLDLRTERECVADGAFEYPGIVTVHIPVLENYDLIAGRLDAIGDDLMPEFYRTLAQRNGGAIALCIAEIVASVVDREPVVVHCTAGKDRTGVVAAIVLSLAGVNDADIAADFARSGDAIPKLNQWYWERHSVTPIEQLAARGFGPQHQDQILGADPATMIAFLATLRADYGSITDYLVWAGADRAQLERLRPALLH